MNFPLARQRFYLEIQQPDEQIDLAKAALYIAQEHDGDLDVDEYLNKLDSMAAEILEQLPKERYPLRMIQTLNHYLYKDLGFIGNKTNYYDPHNSFLNHVLEQRTGIPITLSLVYIEIAKRIDFPMVGIGMPGHFLIRPDFEDVGIYVDAFNGGEVLFPQDCEIRLAQIYGYPVKLKAEFLAPVSRRHFLGRMLTNLKLIYMNVGNLCSALATVEQILLLFPDAFVERRDRGILHYQMEHWTEARQDLESYLENLPTAQDAAIIQQLLDRMNPEM